jgi:hypothetical protein
LGGLALELVAELFGAEAGGAGRIEGEVGIEIGEEGGIIFLLEMNVGEKAIDDGDARSEEARLFGGGESVREALLLEQSAA